MARDEQIEHDSRKTIRKGRAPLPNDDFHIKMAEYQPKISKPAEHRAVLWQDWLPTVATSLDNANRSKQLFQITQLRKLLGWRRSTHEITKHKEGRCIHVVCIVMHRQCKYMCSCTHLKPSLRAVV